MRQFRAGESRPLAQMQGGPQAVLSVSPVVGADNLLLTASRDNVLRARPAAGAPHAARRSLSLSLHSHHFSLSAARTAPILLLISSKLPCFLLKLPNPPETP